ncbi:MAG: hypothetical protein M0R22_11915 [Dehalococcoidia bacterium]|nr:hypothetical protein [Dehalococcoidia bacterium]
MSRTQTLAGVGVVYAALSTAVLDEDQRVACVPLVLSDCGSSGVGPPPRAHVAFVPEFTLSADRTLRDTVGAAVAATHTSIVHARDACRAWITACQARIDAVTMHGEANVRQSRMPAWTTHVGDLPPEVYFAPRYPATTFTEIVYVRALDRARFMTAGVGETTVLDWLGQTTDAGPMLCAATVLGRMLSAFGACITYTMDCALRPRGARAEVKLKTADGRDLALDYIDTYGEPLHLATGDCDETSKLTLAACLAFQRDGPGFHSPVLRGLAQLARAYVFSAVQVQTPVNRGTSSIVGAAAADPVEREAGCAAHLTCLGLPRGPYFRALGVRTVEPTGAAPLPTLVVDGAAPVHPILGDHDRVAGSDYARHRWGTATGEQVRHALRGLYALRQAGTAATAAAAIEILPIGPVAERMYRRFIHLYTWPVSGLPGPVPPARAAFTNPAGTAYGALAADVVAQTGFAISASPPMPPAVLAAVRILLRLQLPPDHRYVTAAQRPVEVPAAVAAVFGRMLAVAGSGHVVPADGTVVTIPYASLPTTAAGVDGFGQRLLKAFSAASATAIVNAVGADRGELVLKLSSAGSPE